MARLKGFVLKARAACPASFLHRIAVYIGIDSCFDGRGKMEYREPGKEQPKENQTNGKRKTERPRVTFTKHQSI